MKNQMELVEKLVQKTGVSYGDAKQALEKCEWDMLEALILLESMGKVDSSAYSSYSTRREQTPPRSDSGDFKRAAGSFWSWCKSVIDKGNRNSFEMYKNGECRLSIPVTLLVVLLIVAFWVFVPLLIVGLFFGYRFSFSGPELGRDDVNEAMGKATNVASNIKEDIRREFDNGSER